MIPCYLICRTPDADVHSRTLLQAFVAQKCVLLELLQRVQCLNDPMVLTADGPLAEKATSYGRKNDRTSNWEEGGTAVWWAPGRLPAAQDAGVGERLDLAAQLSREGEVHIDIALLPTCKVPFLQVSVSVIASSSMPSIWAIADLRFALSTTSKSPSSQPKASRSTSSTLKARCPRLKDSHRGRSASPLPTTLQVQCPRRSRPLPLGKSRIVQRFRMCCPIAT